MRSRALLIGAATVILLSFPASLSGQACFGRVTRQGGMVVVGAYISDAELESHVGWTRIGTVMALTSSVMEMRWYFVGQGVGLESISMESGLPMAMSEGRIRRLRLPMPST